LEFNVPFQHKYGYIRDELSYLLLSACRCTSSDIYSNWTPWSWNVTWRQVFNWQTDDNSRQYFLLYELKNKVFLQQNCT